MSTLECTMQLCRLEPNLLAFTRRFTSDPDEGLDLIQDTLLRALRYRDKFQDGTNLRAWLFTIMRNTFINQYRKNSKNRTSRVKELNTLHIEDNHTFSRPDSNLEYDDIRKKMMDLREELLTPFMMHTNGYQYQEIAEHLNVPLGTVKSRIFLARKELQMKLGGIK